QLVAPEQEKVVGILKQHDKEELQFRKEVEQLTASLAKQEKLLAEKEKASTQFYAQYRELFTKREKLSQEISSFENKVEQLREKVRTQEKELNLVSLKNAEVKARLAGLGEELKRHVGVKLMPEKNVEKLQKDLGRFEIVLSQMSAVNLKALEIYEQIETEFNALVKKKDDLEKEKTDVLALMNEIESKKTEHFLKTFNQANENFQRIFSSLFTKGKAYLQLENPKDIFADGLSIKVRLTGNRFLDIKSLSGGEKTLTALAFIFAIQEYQPASFYVLDEIDAALDKHNSEKLAKLIRNYAERAQYILISHNDALISEADTLFGVSMQDGVSKVTSLKV
ncbi:MAG TPA: AAA family ATPase, partial [bacterium]|nr:AAA family ATPase [bacterium]